MNGELYYKKAINCESDFEDLYRIKCDPENIKWGGFTCPPDRNNFKIWYQQNVNRLDRSIYLVYWGG